MTNWGILGTGGIARKFARSLIESGSEQVVAIASRDYERAAVAGNALQINSAYGSYEELLADPSVEAVYIALPNSMHAEWTIAAARAGKHVLCEKPLALNADEAVTMASAAREHGVWLMEAFMYRFHPQTLRVQELLAADTIGALRQVRASFGITIDEPGNVRLSPELGGGALYDVGCYCVSFARMVAGAAPKRVAATASWISGVDETLVGTLEYASGATAQIACSMASGRNQHVHVIGSHGTIEVRAPFSIGADQQVQITVSRGTRNPTIEIIEIEAVDHFRLEAESFSRLISAGHGVSGIPEMPLVESIDNAATLATLLRSAREGQAIELEG